MADEEKLKSYGEKYEEIKGDIVGTSILKEALKRQLVESDSKLAKLANDITDEKASVWFEKNHQLHQKIDYLKKEFKVNIAATVLMVIFILSLGYLVADLPFSLVSIAAFIMSVIKTVFDIKIYNKNIRKYSNVNIKESDLKNNKITELNRERDKEYTKNVEIRKSIDIVNERLNELGELKLDLENLIICLFSSLDNIIKNQSSQKKPFATWLNISYESDEPKLEISSTMKRIRSKKEEK